MVLESIIRPSTATRHPWEMFFFGILAASAALLLGYWVFPDEADMVLVFFTVMACIPVMFHAIRNEEKKEGIDERALLKEHGRVISFFLFLFLGITLAFVAWYIFLPNEISTTVFQQQLSTIDKINNPAGQAASLDYFSRIFLNNMKVMTFSILFAFFYGAGAIFILTWNASVIAAAIGSMISGLQGQSGVMLSGAYAISRYFIEWSCQKLNSFVLFSFIQHKPKLKSMLNRRKMSFTPGSKSV